MPARKARTVRIHRRADGCLVTRDGQAPATDSPLGVDRNPAMAMGTAVREATMMSFHEGVAVAIEVEQPDGKWKRENVIKPPSRT